MQRWIGFEPGVDTLDVALAETPIPKDFDLLSIDVDGVDWHIWDSIVDYRPRVVIIEFNAQVHHDVIFVQDRDMALSEGCSLAALVELGKTKGYELVTTHSQNAIFVVAEEFAKFGIADNSIETIAPCPTAYIWSCYNGKIYHTLDRLGWNGSRLPLKPDSLQFLTSYSHNGRAQGQPEAPRPNGAEIDLT